MAGGRTELPSQTKKFIAQSKSLQPFIALAAQRKEGLHIRHCCVLEVPRQGDDRMGPQALPEIPTAQSCPSGWIQLIHQCELGLRSDLHVFSVTSASMETKCRPGARRNSDRGAHTFRCWGSNKVCVGRSGRQKMRNTDGGD